MGFWGLVNVNGYFKAADKEEVSQEWCIRCGGEVVSSQFLLMEIKVKDFWDSNIFYNLQCKMIIVILRDLRDIFE